MDNQLQTFIELSTLPALAELTGDARAAWVWSADGGRILWANAAGASFFSVRDVAGLSRLSGLARSPARPHIARIATSGDTDRMSIDRLRFYRGLRVLLLTCQCQRLVLPDGHDAALIVCGDKGLALTEPPLPAFLNLMAGNDRSAFLIEADGSVGAQSGDLTGAPEMALLEGSETVRFAPVRLEDGYHDAAVFRLDPSRTLALVENGILEDMPLSVEEASEEPDPLPEEPAASETGAENPALQAEEQAADTSEDISRDRNLWVRAQDVLEDEPDEIDGEEDGDGDHAGEMKAEASAETLKEAAPAPEAPVAKEAAPVASEDDSFHFVARRRPVRFAWQMDIDQRVTFISDEFAETMGPAAADIVGRTWAEISDSFGIDQNGKIAKALDRRDTWSGKTVNWPVSGAALRVPVDMAALPAFNRDRAFEGYRGFGVCRSADVIEDPDGPVLPASLPVADALPEAPAVEAEAPLHDVAESNEPEAEAAEVEAPEAESPEAEAPEIGTEATEAEIPATPEAAMEPVSPEDKPAAEAEEPAEEETTKAQAAEETEAVATPAAQPDAFSGENSIGSSVAAIVGGLTPKADETQPEAPEAEEPDAAIIQDNEDAPDDETALESEGEETADKAETAPAQAASEESPVEPEATVSEEAVPDYKWEETPSEPAADGEPLGISGPSPLKPAEIETAVKTLAKSYDQKRRQMSDVSRFAIEDETPPLNPEPEPTAIVDEAPAEAAAESSEDVGEDQTGEVEDQTGEAEAKTVADEERQFFDETAAFKEVELDLGLDKEKTVKDKGTSAQLTLVTGDGPPKETSGPAAPPAPVAKDDAKVVRLTGRSRPRLVPVDTSRLSKPEREAFRKIAEALGARLEGDFEEDGPAEEAEALETAAGLNVDRSAGPIHPRLLDRLPIGIAIASDREVLYANDTLLDLLGYPDLAALGEAGGLEAVFADHTEDNLPDAEGMDGVVDGMLKVRLAGGGSRAVDARMHSVPWNGGRGLMISITERPAKPAAPVAVPAVVPEEPTPELQKAQALISEMDAILETATDGVLVIDAHGTITKANRSAEALFSASRTDIEGAPLTDYLAPESHRAALDYLDGLARNGVASILNDGREVLGRVSGGGLIPLFMTIGRITSDNGDAKFCAVLRDITQWKKAEEELTEAKRQAENASSQKSDFLAKISHEIRTPLNAIIGFSEVMMEERFGAIGNDRYKEYLKDIRTSGSHIMSLINDLLDLSKIEAGKLDLRFSAVSANDVINECVALMQPQANRERVIIRASLPDSVPSVVADPRSMRQIVLNLLSNAIKFNKSGGQVIVSTALEDTGEVYLRVRDTGTGMSAKDLAAALEPFRQVHTARHGGGTGLGLPLTKALVEANRASFHIDSTPGQGTLVEISFPSQRVLAE